MTPGANTQRASSPGLTGGDSVGSWRLALGGALLGAALSWTSPSLGQPSLWQRARDPDAQRAYALLTAVERKLVDASSLDLQERHRTYREVMALVAEQDLTSLPDVRLRFLLADVFSEDLVARYRDARRMLDQALKESPQSPNAARGWFLLGVVCAKLDDPDCENLAYTEALEVVHEHDFRANILLNRGESNMVLGNLDAAVSDYRQAVRQARRMDLVSLSYYGLGIALERRGDLPAALQAMRRARANWPALAPYTALDQPSVFFVPSYDIYYYKALEHMALAQHAGRRHEDELEQTHLREAIAHWSSYLVAAEAAGHEYVENARLHRRNCQRDLERSLVRVARHRVAAPVQR